MNDHIRRHIIMRLIAAGIKHTIYTIFVCSGLARIFRIILMGNSSPIILMSVIIVGSVGNKIIVIVAGHLGQSESMKPFAANAS